MRQKLRNIDINTIDYPIIMIPLDLNYEYLWSNSSLPRGKKLAVQGDLGRTIIRLDTGKVLANVSKEYPLISHKSMIKNVEKTLHDCGLNHELFDINFGGKYGNRVYVNYLLRDYAFTIRTDEYIPFIQAYNCYDKFLSYGLVTGLYRASNNSCFIFPKKDLLPKRKHWRGNLEFTEDMIEVKKWISELINLRSLINLLFKKELSNLAVETAIEYVFNVKMHRKRFKEYQVLNKYVKQFDNNYYALFCALLEYATHWTINNKIRSYDKSRRVQMNVPKLFLNITWN